MKHISNQLKRILRSIMPILGMIVFLIILIAGLVVFSYVVVIGAIVGLILFMIAYIQNKFRPNVYMTKNPNQEQNKRGRIIEHHDEHDHK